LLGIPFPDIDAKTADKIVNGVRAAQAERQRATQLLNAAQHAVEIAIETSETAALDWLNTTTGTTP
jgi:type I restriction enzyme S subunit